MRLILFLNAKEERLDREPALAPEKEGKYMTAEEVGKLCVGKG